MRASEDQLRRWMASALDGDASAYTALLTALVPMLRSFFGNRLRDGFDEVEDLMQETMMAIHTRRGTYDRARPFAPWAYAVARYKLIDHFRRTRATVPIDDLENILVSEGFETATAARLDVAKLLGGLSPKQAQAIRATRIEGLSISEAATRADIGESDVKISVHRGLAALARRITGSP